jgi:sugar phosphate permease
MAQQVGTTRMSNSKAAALPLAGHEDLEARTIRQIVWRFMPLLMACYLTAYIDRVNVGFAALSANKDLGLSPSQYGWGAGLFFIGYCLAEFPSNLILVKVGARRWFARIMISMGLVAGATALAAIVIGFLQWSAPPRSMPHACCSASPRRVCCLA